MASKKIIVIETYMEPSGEFNTLRAHDAFMHHGYKSRIFVHVSTHASAIVSAG